MKTLRKGNSSNSILSVPAATENLRKDVAVCCAPHSDGAALAVLNIISTVDLGTGLSYLAVIVVYRLNAKRMGKGTRFRF